MRGAVYQAVMLFTACATVIGFSNKTWAWGETGHEAVALIAEQNMTPQALQQVQAILGDMTMLQASIWPDIVKHTSGWQHTAAYHFADTESGQSYFDDFNRPNFIQNGDVIRALVKAEDILRDSSTTTTQKKYALAFMIHFVGDLHQPLHEGHPEDLGGNKIRATFFGKRTNLHAIWDYGMIDQVVQAASVNVDKTFGFERFLSFFQSPTLQDVQNFVGQMRTPSPVEIAAWQDSYILDWSKDSTADRASIYSTWNGDSEAYQNQWASYVNEKILRGGYRLAGWLDAIMTGQPFQQQKAQDLRQQISQIVGGSNPIVLEPSYGAADNTTFNDPCAHDDDAQLAQSNFNAPGL